MKNAAQPDQDVCEPYGTDVTTGAPGSLSARRPAEDRVDEHANVMRFKTMARETTDPLGARLHDIISDMEAELSQVVDRIVAERH
ncbi:MULTISPECIES: hypothetical protein [unclassified Bradyrhizobium]